jgi:hypothetical protein
VEPVVPNGLLVAVRLVGRKLEWDIGFDRWARDAYNFNSAA